MNKKVKEQEILNAILKEAKNIKRKKELFEDAIKINKELKAINEEGHPGVMLGFGFKNSTTPSPVIGANNEQDNELSELNALAEEIKDIKEKNKNLLDKDEIIKELKQKNEELESTLMEIREKMENFLQEGLFNNLKAGFQGAKAAIKTAVKTGKEAGVQQYQQTKQAQELSNLKQKMIDAVRNKISDLNKSGINVNFQKDIQPILNSFGYQYYKKQILPLSEGESSLEMQEEELNEIFGKFGSMFKGAANQIGKDINKNIVSPIKGYAQKVNNAAKEAGEKYDNDKEQRKIDQANYQEKMQQVYLYNNNMLNSIEKAIQNFN